MIKESYTCSYETHPKHKTKKKKMINLLGWSLVE